MEDAIRKDEQLLGLKEELSTMGQLCEKLQQEVQFMNESALSNNKQKRAHDVQVSETQKVIGENEWLRGQVEQFRLKLKEATEENDKLHENSVNLKKVVTKLQQQTNMQDQFSGPLLLETE